MYNIKNSKELASLICYTNLNNMITEDEMKEFLEKAKEMEFNSVVVSPTYVPLAKEILADTNIKVGSVVGFPLGFEDTEIKVCEAKELVKKDVDEIAKEIKQGMKLIFVEHMTQVRQVALEGENHEN